LLAEFEHACFEELQLGELVGELGTAGVEAGGGGGGFVGVGGVAVVSVGGGLGRGGLTGGVVVVELVVGYEFFVDKGLDERDTGGFHECGAA